MTDNTQDPREYDVVLGGENIIPATGVVLGGIAGVKRRFASAVAEQRMAAVKKYGKAGLEIGIKALEDESELVQKTAYLQLRESKQEEVRQAYCWIEYARLKFNLNAPPGDLPFLAVGGFCVVVSVEKINAYG